MSRVRFPALTLLAMLILSTSARAADPPALNGPYRLIVKGKAGPFDVPYVYLHPTDKLLSKRSATGNAEFYFKSLGGGYHEIRLNGPDGPRLHEDGNTDKLISTRWNANDDFTKFLLEKQSDGSWKIKTKATGRYWHVDAHGDKLVSTRYQPDDDFVRFDLESTSPKKPGVDEPVTFFPEAYTAPVAMVWSLAQRTDNAAKHEAIFTVTWQGKPLQLSMRDEGTAESQEFGTTVRLLGMEKPNFQVILRNDIAQAQNQNEPRVILSFCGHFGKRNGRTVLLLQDLSQFQNEAYTKTDHFVGPFLESIKITYGGASPVWGFPSISPLSQNKNGSYNQSTTMGVDLSVGFQGKVPAGTLGANYSQTASSSTEVADISFTQTTLNSVPIFQWKVGNYYPSEDQVQPYRDDPWNMVRKVAGQVAATGSSVYEAPPIARGTFQVATHCAYSANRTDSLPEYKVRLDYEITYRAVFTDPQKFKNGGEAFGRGFAFVLGLDSNMWSGQTFRTWGTVKTVYKFPVEITIPASVLNQ